MAEKINREVAEAEINKWLDHKKISPAKRETYKTNIDSMVDAVMEGTLVLREDFYLEQNLKFPVGKDDATAKMEYQPRLNGVQIDQAMKGVKATDTFGTIDAYISALTGQVKGVIRQLDSVDKSLANDIVVFFL